ncbi:hypothetical protein DFJ63DRAFT_311649 [Scheffersomyces coipomensis]|uniref:uncharacterized protein n=1 Tax=Scheffersomyces coipomensis TaxID=1788519 RepID=UPI00315CB345
MSLVAFIVSSSYLQKIINNDDNVKINNFVNEESKRPTAMSRFGILIIAYGIISGTIATIASLTTPSASVGMFLLCIITNFSLTIFAIYKSADMDKQQYIQLSTMNKLQIKLDNDFIVNDDSTISGMINFGQCEYNFSPTSTLTGYINGYQALGKGDHHLIAHGYIRSTYNGSTLSNPIIFLTSKQFNHVILGANNISLDNLHGFVMNFGESSMRDEKPTWISYNWEYDNDEHEFGVEDWYNSIKVWNDDSNDDDDDDVTGLTEFFETSNFNGLGSNDIAVDGDSKGLIRINAYGSTTI